MAEGRIYIADKETLDKSYEILKRLDAKLYIGDTSVFDWKTWFESHATGELFSTKFYNYDTTNTGIGEKINDSEGLTCEPSTDTIKGKDDFATHNAFWHIDCNFTINDNGLKVPTAIEGQPEFSRYGKKDVGVLTPPLYWGEEITSDGYIKHFSDKEHPTSRPDLTLTLCPWCKDMKGNPMPYGIVTKYYATELDGLLYSSSGEPLCNFVSENIAHTKLQKKGSMYLGSGSERTAYLKNFLWIKYATLNSQKYFKGNTQHSEQFAAAESIDGVKYIPLLKDQASKFYVGDTVSVGEAGENAATSTDRGKDYMRNIADKVRITKIEEIDSQKVAVYLDIVSPFDVTTTTYISTMPLHSGQTDKVLGSDGSMTSNTDGKHSFKIQGVEDGVGAYYLCQNEIVNKETSEKSVLYNRNGGDFATDIDSISSKWKKTFDFTNPGSPDLWIGEENVDLETGSSFVKTVGNGDSVGTGDRYYWGGTATGLREKLERGYLWNWSGAGLSYVTGGGGLSSALWSCGLCV